MTQTGEPSTQASPERVVAVPVRHYGRWISALLVVVVIAWLVRAFSQADINYSTTGQFFTAENVIRGAGRTLLISVLAQAMGVGLGVLFAVMRLSHNPVTSSVAWFYIWPFRGSPALAPLPLSYNLAPPPPTLAGPPHRALSPGASGVALPYLAMIRLSSEPALTPIRSDTPASAA